MELSLYFLKISTIHSAVFLLITSWLNAFSQCPLITQKLLIEVVYSRHNALSKWNTPKYLLVLDGSIHIESVVVLGKSDRLAIPMLSLSHVKTLLRSAARPALQIILLVTFLCFFGLPANQGGITCGAIDEPRKSSKALDKRVIINFRDKNVVIARFRDKNGGFIL